MIVPLKSEIHVIFVKDITPKFADVRIVSGRRGGVSGMMIDGKLPGSFGLCQGTLKPSGLALGVNVGPE